MDDLATAVLRLSTDESEWQAASARCLAFMAREYPEDRILAPYVQAFGAEQGGTR
jgi:hypothetical protein